MELETACLDFLNVRIGRDGVYGAFPVLSFGEKPPSEHETGNPVSAAGLVLLGLFGCAAGACGPPWASAGAPGVARRPSWAFPFRFAGFRLAACPSRCASP